MIQQIGLFEGERRKREGISKVASHSPTFVELMRGIAIQISVQRGSVSTDDLREYAKNHGISAPHRNAWGAILRGKGWEFIEWRRSEFKTNNARRIAIVRWIGDRIRES